MPSKSRDGVVPAFSLRLVPSIRQTAEVFSQKEGVSLNQLINVAVTEKLAQLQHEEWLRSRKQHGPEVLAEGLELLARSGTRPVEPGDELTEGYLPRQDFKSRKNG